MIHPAMTPDELEAALRAIGAERYHNLHPFHRLLHGGRLSRGQVQAWALNRYYYQAAFRRRTPRCWPGCRRPTCAANGGAGWTTMTATGPAPAASSAG